MTFIIGKLEEILEKLDFNIENKEKIYLLILLAVVIPLALVYLVNLAICYNMHVQN